MPDFLVTADGKKFKVTAPDQETALAAFAEMAGLDKGDGAPPPDQPTAPTGVTMQPNLGGLPAVGSLLSAMGYNGVPQPTAEGYEPSSVPLLDPVNSLAHGFLNGIPVAGPALEGLANKLDAMTYGEDPREREKLNAADQAQYQTANTIGEVAGTVAPLAAAGATAVGSRLLGLTGRAVPRTLASMGSTAALSTADQMVRGDSFEDAARDAILPTAVAGVIPGAERVASAILKSFGKTAAPTVEALKAEAGQVYDAARGSGKQLNQSGTINLSDQMYDLAKTEGIISPTGRVSGAYPKISESLRLFDDYANGTMTVPQMQAVRKTLQDAAGSSDAGERRLGTIMLRKFDDLIQTGVPELGEAGAIYHRAMKGDEIETAIELAGSRAGQFSGSGFENALRTEFRALERKAIKGELRGYTDDEIEAIKKVAHGGPIESFFRFIGKAAPTGVVSAGVGGGLGMAMAGGNPLGAAAVWGTGAGAREIATAMLKRRAAEASALVRRGGPHVPTGGQAAILKALTSGAIPMSLLARSAAMESVQ